MSGRQPATTGIPQRCEPPFLYIYICIHIYTHTHTHISKYTHNPNKSSGWVAQIKNAPKIPIFLSVDMKFCLMHTIIRHIL